MKDYNLHPDDSCPACRIGILELKKVSYPFQDYYLKCDCCDVIFEIDE